VLDHHGLPVGGLSRAQRNTIAEKLRAVAQTTEAMLKVNTEACLVDEALVIDAASEPIVFERFPADQTTHGLSKGEGNTTDADQQGEDRDNESDDVFCSGLGGVVGMFVSDVFCMLCYVCFVCVVLYVMLCMLCIYVMYVMFCICFLCYIM
jgi:hypothetical protein